jgi:DsbC/DsbD-like thiol-disulfide interchange protein
MKTIAVAALFAAALAAAPPDPVAWKVAAPAKPVKPGAAFPVTLTAKIQDGWHIYGLKAVADGPIPTRIWLADNQPVSLAGSTIADDPQTLRDPAFNMDVQLYEGEADFKLRMVVLPAAAAGPQKIVVNASYQSCDNKLCLPPKTVKIEVPVTVAK